MKGHQTLWPDHTRSIPCFILNSEFTSPATTEIESLIFLLEDPDEFVRESVRQRLQEIGEAAVPKLDQARSSTKDEQLRESITAVIYSITFEGFEQDFTTLMEQGIDTAEDLEEALLMFSRFDDPTLRTSALRRSLDEMADEIAPQIFAAVSERKKMLTLIQFVYGHKQFRGCESDYLNPKHSFMHTVLSERSGIPLSLAFVILLLARRLNLPFYGINMPLHFLVKYVTADNEHILIDPFNNGGILSRAQCEAFLKKSGIKAYDQHFEATPPMAMFTRFLRNLMNGYQQKQQPGKVEDLGRLLSIVEGMNGNPAG